MKKLCLFLIFLGPYTVYGSEVTQRDTQSTRPSIQRSQSSPNLSMATRKRGERAMKRFGRLKDLKKPSQVQS